MDDDGYCGCTITNGITTFVDENACGDLLNEDIYLGGYDIDNDSDGIPNSNDACPNAADGHDWDYTLDEYGEPISLIECLAIGGIWDYYNETCGDGICDSSDPCVGEIDAGICVGNEPELPDQLTLSQNYPNPFNPITKIDYSVPSPERISIYLYDNSGRLIKKLINNKFHLQEHYTLEINGQNLSSGVYFIQLISSTKILSKKITILK